MENREYLFREMMKIYCRLNITNKLKMLSYAKLARDSEKQAKNKALLSKGPFYQ
ncbi:hypothetical protein CE91St36_20320 [Christensenellaceae bacterium]|nr:hypothetical protein CE91St36_20320 [Christensenellaceae bacterium]BDF61881.1 hypothetical protein CE91St37_20310 [Christensenellaceae bacterium]